MERFEDDYLVRCKDGKKQKTKLHGGAMYVLLQKNMFVTQGLSRLRHILYEAQTTQRSYK